MIDKNAQISSSQAISIPMKSLVNQDSTLSSRRQNAICVRRAYKTYGTKANPNIILDGLNMTVPKGTIYGLLGASGCGKTTLLSCIVGRRRLNSGDIWVLGGKPGGRGSGVPGPRIGYMPQEVALYGEFTVKETLTYFGWLCGISSKVISERFEFLLELLQLPFPERPIKNLSGGQQRRVSFAAALVHDPELLILDEPTVGLDPLLRQNIWNYLVDLTNKGQKTIIITTHYIDETRQANIIGLMRGGRFLAEESPKSLLQRYECESLENVFLKLAILQNRFKRRRSSIIKTVTEVVKIPAGEINAGVIISDDEKGEISGEFGDNISMTSSSGRFSITPDVSDKKIIDNIPPDDDVNESYWDYCVLFRMYHMKALMWKNMMWMWRNFGLLCFMILLPLMQMILFCLTIGHNPKHLKLAVTNFEVNTTSLSLCDYERHCNGTKLSCGYLKHLTQRSNFNLRFYKSENDAKNAVISGNAWAALTIQKNYSQALFQRIKNGKDTETWDIESSLIKIWQDMSDQQIATLLYRDFNYAYLDFIKELLKDCDINPKIGKLPIKINDAIYGLNNPNFTDFAAPGIILTIIFFMAVALTTGAILHERNEGILERALVVGITGTEILFALVGTEFLIVLIHTGLVLSVGFLMFDLTIKGNLLWVILLSIMTGMCGMCFGFVVSTACDNERTATYAALGCFLPIVMLCGVIWPIEGMHYLLRKFAYFLPLTLSTESIRSILQRGWSMDVPHIYNGFISTFIWIWIFLTLSILVLKFKKG